MSGLGLEEESPMRPGGIGWRNASPRRARRRLSTLGAGGVRSGVADVLGAMARARRDSTTPEALAADALLVDASQSQDDRLPFAPLPLSPEHGNTAAPQCAGAAAGALPAPSPRPDGHVSNKDKMMRLLSQLEAQFIARHNLHGQKTNLLMSQQPADGLSTPGPAPAHPPGATVDRPPAPPTTPTAVAPSKAPSQASPGGGGGAPALRLLEHLEAKCLSPDPGEALPGVGAKRVAELPPPAAVPPTEDAAVAVSAARLLDTLDSIAALSQPLAAIAAPASQPSPNGQGDDVACDQMMAAFEAELARLQQEQDVGVQGGGKKQRVALAMEAVKSLSQSQSVCLSPPAPPALPPLDAGAGFQTASRRALPPPSEDGRQRAQAIMSSADNAGGAEPALQPVSAALSPPPATPDDDLDIPDDLLLAAAWTAEQAAPSQAPAAPLPSQVPPAAPTRDALVELWKGGAALGHLKGDDTRFVRVFVVEDSGDDGGPARMLRVWQRLAVSSAAPGTVCACCDLPVASSRVEEYATLSQVLTNDDARPGGVPPDTCGCTFVAQARTVVLQDLWTTCALAVGNTVHVVFCHADRAAMVAFDGALPALTTDAIVVDADHNAIVVHPDVLVSPTRIASGLACLRRSIFSELVAGGGTAKAALWGQLKHSLFEAAMAAGKADVGTLQTVAAAIVRTPSVIKKLYECDESEGDALDALLSSIPAIRAWFAMYVPRGDPVVQRFWGATVDTGHSRQTHVAVNRVASVEEVIWSPMWGVKGIVDATVDVSTREAGLRRASSVGSVVPPPGTPSVVHTGRLPLELKTGRRGGGMSINHRAQVALYALLMADRHVTRTAARVGVVDAGAPVAVAEAAAASGAAAAVAGLKRSASASPYTSVGVGTQLRRGHGGEPADTHPTAGLLLYMSQRGVGVESSEDPGFTMYGVPVVWAELRSLILRRNELAVALKHAAVASRYDAFGFFPPVIDAKEDCERCYMQAACFATHAAQDMRPGDGVPDGDVLLEVAAQFRSITSTFTKATSHLRPGHLGYLRRWWSLVDLEAAHNAGPTSGGFWSVAARARESQSSRCVAGLELVSSQAEEAEVVIAPGVVDVDHLHSFRRLPPGGSKPLRSILELDFGVGDWVHVSVDGGPCAVLSGSVHSLAPTEIVVKSPGPLPVDLVPSGGAVRDVEDCGGPRATMWRVDRGDSSAPIKLVKDNLVRLLMGPVVTDHTVGGDTEAEFDGATLEPIPKPADGDGAGAGAAAAKHPGDAATLRRVVDIEAPGFSTAVWSPDMVCGEAAVCDRLVADFDALNDGQKQAVAAVMRSKDYVCLLGMPGTGKTSTIAFLVRALVACGQSVLVAAYTHSAVDSVLLKLVGCPGVDVLRMGRERSVHPGVLHKCLDAQLGADRDDAIATVAAYRRRLNEATVVGTTCLGIGHAVFERRLFDVVIVDEASQVTEPVCLGPLRCARRFVLVGDHNQLPPLVRSPEAQANGMAVSLLKRLCDAHPQATVKLTHQYRMNADIQCLANTLVYKNALRCGTEAVATSSLSLPGMATVCETRSPPAWVVEALQPHRRVVFVDTDPLSSEGLEVKRKGVAQSVGGTLVNREEAAAVGLVVSVAVAAGCDAGDVGIISPYRSQLRLLRLVTHAADSPQTAGVEVETVDRYQGRDKDVMVLSLVRSNCSGQVGRLLSDLRRINVALTRAKKKLVIVGSRRTLKAAEATAPLMGLLCDKGWVMPLPGSHEAAFRGMGDALWQRVVGVGEAVPVAVEKVEKAVATAGVPVKAVPVAVGVPVKAEPGAAGVKVEPPMKPAVELPAAAGAKGPMTSLELPPPTASTAAVTPGAGASVCSVKPPPRRSFGLRGNLTALAGSTTPAPGKRQRLVSSAFGSPAMSRSNSAVSGSQGTVHRRVGLPRPRKRASQK